MSDTPPIASAVEHSALVAVLVTGFMGALPTILNIIGATAAFIWFVICIKESKTYIHWISNRRMKRNAKNLMKLRAKEKRILAKIEAAELVRAARLAARDLLEHEIAEADKLVAQNNVLLKADLLSNAEVVKTAKDRMLPEPDPVLDPNKMP